MITQLLVDFLFGAIRILLNAIPTIELSPDFLDSISSVTVFTNAFAYFLPMKTIMLCLTIFFTLSNARLAFSVFNFIIRKIPGIN